MAGTIIADTWQNGDGTQNYKCRAWVNFNGQGTVAIRASGNVSSITDNGVGNYTVNFTTPMPDANYSVSGTGSTDGGHLYTVEICYISSPTVNAVRIESGTGGVPGLYVKSNVDTIYTNIAIFR